MVGDTNTLGDEEKGCSICGEKKKLDRIVKNRNVCKDCCNVRKKTKYKELVINDENSQTCNTCNQTKVLSSFIKNRRICKDCNNEKRSVKYKTNEQHRLKLIEQATKTKHNKVMECRKKKLEELGEGNKKCSVCSEIKSQERFRHNRLRCRDCERDNPIDKFKRNVRGRIWYALGRRKEMHTIEYLGCNSKEYSHWILTYDEKYNLENRGKE